MVYKGNRVKDRSILVHRFIMKVRDNNSHSSSAYIRVNSSNKSSLHKLMKKMYIFLLFFRFCRIFRNGWRSGVVVLTLTAEAGRITSYKNIVGFQQMGL